MADQFYKMKLSILTIGIVTIGILTSGLLANCSAKECLECDKTGLKCSVCHLGFYANFDGVCAQVFQDKCLTVTQKSKMCLELLEFCYLRQE